MSWDCMKCSTSHTTKLTFSDIGVTRHLKKEFDLREEPWIPVVDVSGKRSVVGLKTFFEKAHEYADIDTDNPLESLALYRYLISLTISMVYTFKTEDWDEKWVALLGPDGSPFPSEPIKKLLDRLEEHCWLWHPKTPFMQTSELLDKLTIDIKKGDTPASIGDPYEVLLAHVPSKSNESVWYKTLPAPSEQELVRALLLRHYAAAAGNVPKNTVSKGPYSAGGQVMPGRRSTTQLMWKGPTVAKTLLCNITNTYQDYSEQEKLTFFWESPQDSAKVEDPLWLYTYSCATSFIVKTGLALEPYRVLRSNLLMGIDLQKDIFSLACANDPHVMLSRENKEGTTESSLKGTKRVIFAANVSQFRNVYALYRVAQNPDALLTCVMQKGALRYGDQFKGLPLRATSITAGGTTTGARYESAVVQDIDAMPFLMDREKHDILRGVMETLAGTTKSVRQLTLQRLKAVCMYEAATLGPKVDVLLWSELDESISAIYEDVRTGKRMDSSLQENDKHIWSQSALSVYMAVCAPLVGSSGTAAKVYKNKVELTRQIRNLL